jgi:inosine-uridine nucleoside N-ribohydrolase
VNNWRRITGKFGPPFRDSVHWHDPLAAAYLFHPDLFTTELMDFTVRPDGGLVAGNGTPAVVCTGMDASVLDIIAMAVLGRTVKHTYPV